MATHKIGKLKFRFNDGALEYRWSDGEVRRFGLGKKQNDEYQDDYADAYEEGYEGEENFEPDYGDDYAPDSYGDYEDEYEEAYDDDYADEPYEDDYADDGYADDYEDDGYGGGYDDDYEDGYDGEYDDRYSDEDADDGYYEDGYEESGYPEGTLGSVLQYVDENDWVTYLLLFLLPPLGIYLLWRRQRFDKTMRYALSAASAVWFIVLIILLMMVLFGGGSDKPGNIPTLPSQSPTVQASASASPSATTQATATPTAGSLLAVTPSPTPIGTAATTSSNLVWCSATGNLYHKTNTCTAIATGESVSQVTIDNAKSRNKYQCPVCFGGEVYYATAGGRWYHKDPNCNMKNAVVYSKEQAEDTGKTACPVCVTGEQQSLNNENLGFVTTNTKDKSGIKVWYTSSGSNYHMTKNCRGMSGASQHSLRDALIDGKTACSTCCAASGTLVYCTASGSNYHTHADCRGMKNAKRVTVAEALVLGKTPCDTCKPIGSSGSTASGNTGSTENSGEYYVYANPNGKYYHLDEHCDGMQNASKVTLKSMIEAGRPACPTCCSGANMSVYVAQGGTYYHSYATCTGMKNAVEGPLAYALALGYQRCTKCWGDNTVSNDPASTTTADTLKVYANPNGKYYHTNKTCTGMKNAVEITLRQAVAAGKPACPTCAAAAQAMVYSTDNGKYYHKSSTCTNMEGAERRTLADALLLNQTACPTCMSSNSGTTENGNGATGNETVPESGESGDGSFTVGKSGVKVYAVAGGEYYHMKSSCGGSSTGTKVALETALNNGMVACPDCTAVAETTVYATSNGKYYHLSKSCAGSGAMAGTFAYALAYGFDACPYCVSTSSSTVPTTGNNYDLGTSGVNVYATVDGTYYHADKSCAPSSAVMITLETALNYGKKACPDCSAVANRTVYATKNSKYYHANKSCAGANAVAGTFAQALAYGLDACPNCVGTSGDGTAENYSAPYSTTVYVDLYSEEFYYHKASKCSGSGMSGGTAVTLQFVKDLGYAKCPHCNPPSSIS